MVKGMLETTLTEVYQYSEHKLLLRQTGQDKSRGEEGSEKWVYIGQDINREYMWSKEMVY